MVNWRNGVAEIGVLILAVATQIVAAQTASPPAVPSPGNPNASPEARALLQYLYSISGRYTLSGQHNFPNSIARWTDRVYDFTGKYPAVYGQDFGFEGGDDKDSVEARPALIQGIKRQYRNGAIITLTWHAVRPTHDEPVRFRENILSHLTDFEWNELITPGTRLNERWCGQVDVVAGYLKQLRDARIAVLWRPYHEINGDWFWWGGRKGESGSTVLCRQLFDRLVNTHGLKNLIWVWVPASPGFTPGSPGQHGDFFPGLAYADAVAVDVEDGSYRWPRDVGLSVFSFGKAIGLGFSGQIQAPTVFEQQRRWAWFLAADDMSGPERSEALRKLYDDPRVLSHGAETESPTDRRARRQQVRTSVKVARRY